MLMQNVVFKYLMKVPENYLISQIDRILTDKTLSVHVKYPLFIIYKRVKDELSFKLKKRILIHINLSMKHLRNCDYISFRG